MSFGEKIHFAIFLLFRRYGYFQLNSVSVNSEASRNLLSLSFYFILKFICETNFNWIFASGVTVICLRKAGEKVVARLTNRQIEMKNKKIILQISRDILDLLWVFFNFQNCTKISNFFVCYSHKLAMVLFRNFNGSA